MASFYRGKNNFNTSQYFK